MPTFSLVQYLFHWPFEVSFLCSRAPNIVHYSVRCLVHSQRGDNKLCIVIENVCDSDSVARQLSFEQETSLLSPPCACAVALENVFSNTPRFLPRRLTREVALCSGIIVKTKMHLFFDYTLHNNVSLRHNVSQTMQYAE